MRWLALVSILCVASVYAQNAEERQVPAKQGGIQNRDLAAGGGGHGGGYGGPVGGGPIGGGPIGGGPIGGGPIGGGPIGGGPIGGGFGGGPIGGGSLGGGYGAPAAPAYQEPAKDTGYYYYYYPVVPESNKKGGLFGGSGKGFFGKMMENIMYPIMMPFMMMYEYFEGRSLNSRISDYIPTEIVNKVTALIVDEIYKDDCLPRFICHLGKKAEGYETFVNLSDFFVPAEYDEHLRTFKDSALNKKVDCIAKYKCSSFDYKS